jgi:hypothetical protein
MSIIIRSAVPRSPGFPGPPEGLPDRQHGGLRRDPAVPEARKPAGASGQPSPVPGSRAWPRPDPSGTRLRGSSGPASGTGTSRLGLRAAGRRGIPASFKALMRGAAVPASVCGGLVDASAGPSGFPDASPVPPQVLTLWTGRREPRLPVSSRSPSRHLPGLRPCPCPPARGQPLRPDRRQLRRPDRPASCLLVCRVFKIPRPFAIMQSLLPARPGAPPRLRSGNPGRSAAPKPGPVFTESAECPPRRTGAEEPFRTGRSQSPPNPRNCGPVSSGLRPFRGFPPSGRSRPLPGPLPSRPSGALRLNPGPSGALCFPAPPGHFASSCFRPLSSCLFEL